MNELHDVGEKLGLLLAGVFGGLVRFIFAENHDESFWRSAAYLMAGGLCSYYITPAIIAWQSYEEHYVGVFGFFIGFASMNLARGLMKIADKFEQSPERWINKWFGNGEKGKD